MAHRARIFVTKKKGVLDPQGEAVSNSLSALGFANVKEVRIGKVIDISIEETIDADELCRRLSQMAQQLLANPVMEDYSVEFASHENRSSP